MQLGKSIENVRRSSPKIEALSEKMATKRFKDSVCKIVKRFEKDSDKLSAKPTDKVIDENSLYKIFETIELFQNELKLCTE